MPAKQITLNMALAVDSISFDAVRVALDLVANMQRLEMTVRFFIQRLEQSGISEQRRQPVSKIDYQKLREIAEKTKIAGEAPVMPFDQRINALNDFMKHFSPATVLALLDERERNQQYIKRRDQENEEIALTVGKLRVELEAAENNLIDSECHVAELEEALRDKQALLEASEKRIAELEAEPVSQTYKLPVNTPCQDAPAHIWLQTAGVWPEDGELSELTWCSHNQHHDDTLYVRADLVNGNSPVTPARLPGGFTIEDAKALHEDLVRSHISQALSGEKMKKNDRDADLRWIHGVIVQAAWFVKASLEQNALSGNYPVTPDGWISCSDRMPEDTKMLLAFSQGEIVAAYWNWVVNPIDYKKYRAFTYLSGNILDDVTHWMPLPEPPQEEVNRG